MGRKKTCTVCKRILPLGEFYEAKHHRDGKASCCKECHLGRCSKRYREKWGDIRKTMTTEEYREYQKAYQDSYRKRDDVIRRMKKYRKDYAAKNRKKKAAQSAAQRALKSGLIKRCPCVNCGSQNVQMHHDDYDKPLEVEWMCKSCHRILHFGVRKDVALRDKGNGEAVPALQ